MSSADRDDPKAGLLVNDSMADSTAVAIDKPSDALKKEKDAPPAAPVTGWRRYCQGKQALVGMYSAALLVAAVGNSIFFKVRESDSIPSSYLPCMC